MDEINLTFLLTVLTRSKKNMKKKLLITLYITATMLPQILGQNSSAVVTNGSIMSPFTNIKILEDVKKETVIFSPTTDLNIQVGHTPSELSSDMVVIKTHSMDANSVTPEWEISNDVVTQKTGSSHKTSMQDNDSDITTTLNLILYQNRENFQTTTQDTFSDSPPMSDKNEISKSHQPGSIEAASTNVPLLNASTKRHNENISSVTEQNTETESKIVFEMIENNENNDKLNEELSHGSFDATELYFTEINLTKKEITENYDSYETTEDSSIFSKSTKKPGTTINKQIYTLQPDGMVPSKNEASFKEKSGFFTVTDEIKKPSSSETSTDISESPNVVSIATELIDSVPVYKGSNKSDVDFETGKQHLENETSSAKEKEEDKDVGIEFKDDSFSKIHVADLDSSKKDISMPDVKKTIGIVVSDIHGDNMSSNKTSIYKSSVKVGIMNPTISTAATISETESDMNFEFVEEDSKIGSPTDNMDFIIPDPEPTRVPKKIQNDYERPHESRSRPARPDPGYHSYNQEYDYNRPYRPDSPSYERPYFRPTPDYRTPLIRQGPDYTRPSRPDQDSKRTSYRPEFGIVKYPTVDSDQGQQTSQESSRSRPYRPAFGKPYRPQSSFSKPYHPDYHKPSASDSQTAFGKPDYLESSKPDAYDTNLYQQSTDDSERTRDDLEYTRQADANMDHTKSVPDSIRQMTHSGGIKQASRPIIMDSKKTAQTSQDSIIDETEQKTSRPAIIDTRSRPTSDSYYKTPEVQSQTMDVTKPTKINAGQVGGYPRPGFGSNYGEKPQTTSTPFPPSSVMISMRNLTRVEIIKADCFDNHMKVSVRFNGSFEGLIYSSGYSYDPTCNYINGSGRHQYDFFIRLNRCGTLGQHEVPDPSAINFARRRQERAQYLVNTVSVQYNPMIEEDTDEHFRVTCEYGYDFWKTVTFPVINIESSAVKVREGSPMVFTLPPPQCNMEIRSGYGPTGNRISGPVNVGDPISLVIHMKSETPGFDILVSNCVAHNGAKKRLQLIDANGCVVQEKLISAFRGVSGPDRTQQLTLYSYLKAFRFTGSPALYIECDVHMCHGSCPPQRCYWRHLYKRSIENVTTPLPEKDGNGILSESVSLFQALEVRHDDVDLPNPVSVWKKGSKEKDDAVCMRKTGFAAIFSSLLVLVLVCSAMSMFLCSKIRRMKYVEAPPAHSFTELTCRLRR